MDPGRTQPHRLSTPMGGEWPESLIQGIWSGIGVPSGSSPNTDSGSWRGRGTQEPMSPPTPQRTASCIRHRRRSAWTKGGKRLANLEWTMVSVASSGLVRPCKVSDRWRDGV